MIHMCKCQIAKNQRNPDVETTYEDFEAPIIASSWDKTKKGRRGAVTDGLTLDDVLTDINDLMENHDVPPSTVAKIWNYGVSLHLRPSTSPAAGKRQNRAKAQDYILDNVAEDPELFRKFQTLNKGVADGSQSQKALDMFLDNVYVDYVADGDDD